MIYIQIKQIVNILFPASVPRRSSVPVTGTPTVLLIWGLFVILGVADDRPVKGFWFECVLHHVFATLHAARWVRISFTLHYISIH